MKTNGVRHHSLKMVVARRPRQIFPGMWVDEQEFDVNKDNFDITSYLFSVYLPKICS